MAPDVNVLIAAYREDHVHHPVARAWLAQSVAACATGGAIEILPMVGAGFLRLVTNRKIFPVGASSPDQAVAFLRSLLAVRGVVMPSLGPEWGLFEKLCVDLRVAGPAVTDAWIAAAVSAGGLHLVTFDESFRKLLRPSEFTLLRPGSRIAARRAKYTVHRPQRAEA
ncbi:MAG: TA system VapC family ribonuclease toxin [Nevskiales bacterium]